jgi:hypothetical protein
MVASPKSGRRRPLPHPEQLSLAAKPGLSLRLPRHCGAAGMSDVFISYARPSEAAAKRIAEALGAIGYAVWRDELPVARAGLASA